MPAGTANKVSGLSGTIRAVIAFAVIIVAAYALGSFYAGASAHKGIGRPLVVLFIDMGALIFLLRWAKAFTGTDNRQLHIWMAVIACYICWLVSWDIEPYGGYYEITAQDLLVNPTLVVKEMNTRYHYLIGHRHISVFYQPYLLRTIYVAEAALFAFLAKYLSLGRLF
ncbi:hypothetical protein [Chitinophaga agri]|uniref:Uncharacterized protein n=1 Tax=Chitinophaga agri TaxID=2703787 RepID=A0A6B9ZNC0_9BACT|nr:hypothetical protein [Chitinophaga agri]QHS63379.1 hypothetical protein GWR21_28465 [Chitinophaga agri]